jgi:hypothetical protein
MANEKQFIGKVTERVFETGGSIIRLSLGDKDREKIAALKKGWFNIAIKKSLSGVWYAEVDTYEQSKIK